ncbi:MAG TPA: putative metal-binding motif-containing protein, partial [Myxococcota bacterium]|nr:putative metal-binding motif-containing protein [Myxococcota bacterium]
MLFLLLMGCLYDKDRLDWVYTQLEDDDGDGYREIDGDCDDSSSAVHPEVDEICDGLDNDCNGDADGDALDIRAWFQDRDQDGYGNDDVSRLSCDPVPTYSEENGDCDDDDATVHPDAEVICGEPGDRNCDGVPEDEDLDQDGWARCEDCDDLERKVNPGEVEVCNEYDDNCDGQIDEVGALETTWFPDADGDGYGDPDGAVVSCARPQGYTFDGGDCDDHDNDINPGESEICGNDADDNCNGAADGCRLEGELEVGASFVGVEGMGIGDGSLVSVLNAGDTNGDGYQDLLFATRGQVLVQPGPFLGTDVPVTTGATFIATDPGG